MRSNLIRRWLKRREKVVIDGYRERRLIELNLPIDPAESIQMKLVALEIEEKVEHRLRMIEELVLLNELRGVGPAVRELSELSRSWPRSAHKNHFLPALRAVTSFARMIAPSEATQ